MFLLLCPPISPSLAFTMFANLMFSNLINARFYRRIAPWMLAAALLSVPLLLYGAVGALAEGNNDVRQWLPSGFRETQEYDAFVDRFGSEEMAVVSWPDCALDDPRLDRFADEMRPLVAERAVERPSGDSQLRPLFKRVLTSTQAVAQLTGEPMRVPHDEAVRRMRGLLIGDDGTAAAIVMVNEQGAADRRTALEQVYAAAERAGISRDDVRLAGPTADSVALETESRRSRYLLAAVSFVVALALAWRSLRSIRLAAMVFATATLCAGISVALVYLLGGTMNLLMGMMPTLIYLLALSGSIHLTNYYRELVGTRGPEEAPAAAVRAAFTACFLSAATTAVGLGSLALSEVTPVRMFGIYSALGVLVTLPVIYLFLPSLLQLWPIVVKNAAPIGAESGEAAPTTMRGVETVLRYKHWVVGACLALTAAGVFGVSRLNMSVKLLNLFSPQSRIIADYAWLERHLGPMVPVEIVLRFDEANRMSMLQRLELVGRIEARLNQVDKVGGTMSAATFAPPLPAPGGASQTTQRAVATRRLEKQREYLAGTHYLATEGGAEMWRISARVEALNSLDYGNFTASLREQVEPELQRVATDGDKPVAATYTGIVPLVYKAQRTLLDDLTSSFISAFALIGLMMIGLLRSVRAGLVAMLPNIFPAVVLFGAMGLSGTLCDIGSMMTAGAAMGIAVDDTIHFLTWFRRVRDTAPSRDAAIRRAHAHCAPAMVKTTLICGLGLLVFSLSSFVPTSRFAWLMAAMLGVGLVGDLIFLPALLSGPLGRYFDPRSRRRSAAAAPVPAVGESSRAGACVATASA